jgi:Uma2 family endonuclease
MRFTEPEYLALEGVAEIRHEYFGGEIIARDGEDVPHNVIVGNIHFLLGRAFAERPVHVLGSLQRVLVVATREYAYPDLVVITDAVALAPPRPTSITNPDMIFEVLSPMTELHDRGAKWIAYRTIPTLTDYVMISSARRELEHYHRDADGTWRSIALRDGACKLSNDIALDLDKVYRLVDFTS